MAPMRWPWHNMAQHGAAGGWKAYGGSIYLCSVEDIGYGSIPMNTIFRGMNIHLPAILMFTRGTRFWHTAILDSRPHSMAHRCFPTLRSSSTRSIAALRQWWGFRRQGRPTGTVYGPSNGINPQSYLFWKTGCNEERKVLKTLEFSNWFCNRLFFCLGLGWE